MRYATCHTDRKHHCKGLCQPCYGKQRPALSNTKKQEARQRAKKWRAENRERAYQVDASKHLLRNYGITREMYVEMYNSQSGLCKICKKAETLKIRNNRTNKLAVDHCHNTGKVRGLLCFKCNTSLARIEDVGITNFKIYLEENEG